MSRRTVLGRYADSTGAASRLSVPVWNAATHTTDRNQLVKDAVERVRRHFGRTDKARGNKYARVAYAYFQHRSWYKTGLSKSSFFHASKKVRKFFEADKHWVGLTNLCRRRNKQLDRRPFSVTISEGA